MSGTLQFRLVDAFAEQPFTGNTAGVVLDADALDEQQMQAVAREVNASETAFITEANDLHRPPRLRWFTPATEVGFCGHATLAAAHAWSELAGFRALLNKREAQVEFRSAAGQLRLWPEPAGADRQTLIWWLQMPAPGLEPANTNPMKLTKLLGLTLADLEPAAPIMRTRDHDLIVLIRSWRALMEARPNFQELAAFSQRQSIRGVCVATRDTLDDFIHVVSRFFAPACGVPEDPVTGSVHGPLAALLTIHELVPRAGNRTALNCLQGQPGGRTGLVRALVERGPDGYRVSIGGICQTTIRGELRLPPRGRSG